MDALQEAIVQAKLKADLIARKDQTIADLTEENALLRAGQCQCAGRKVKQGFIQENGTLRSYKYVEVN